MIKVYGHKDGTGSFSAPAGPEDECGGHLLMTVDPNYCKTEILSDNYAIPSGGPLGSTFVISICRDDVPKGMQGHVLNLPFHKDPTTLIQVNVQGELISTDNVDVESWRIWEDQKLLLEPCVKECPALAKALVTPDTTLEQVLPSDAPQTVAFLESACDIKTCIQELHMCQSLPLNFDWLPQVLDNMECSCACKSAFSKPDCGHVDLCNPGDCKEDVLGMWSCAKKEPGHCMKVLNFVQSNPKVLECVELKPLSQIALPSTERLYSLNDALWPSNAKDQPSQVKKASDVKSLVTENVKASTPYGACLAGLGTLGWAIFSIQRRRLALETGETPRANVLRESMHSLAE